MRGSGYVLRMRRLGRGGGGGSRVGFGVEVEGGLRGFLGSRRK